MPPGPGSTVSQPKEEDGVLDADEQGRTPDAPAPSDAGDRQPQDSQGATCPPGDAGPGPLALGSLTDTPSSSRTPPAPPTPSAPGGRPPASPELGGEVPGPPLPSRSHTQNGCSGGSGQQGHGGANQHPDRHTAAAQAAAARTQRPNTQGQGRVPGGLPGRAGSGWGADPGVLPTEPRPRGPERAEGQAAERWGRAGGRERGAGRRRRRVIRKPSLPGEDRSHLRNFSWPAWW